MKEWLCSSCTTPNSRDLKECVTCNAKQLTGVMESIQTSSPEGGNIKNRSVCSGFSTNKSRKSVENFLPSFGDANDETRSRSPKQSLLNL